MSIESSDYSDGVNPEHALKYAVQHVRGDRVQVVEGVIEPMSPPWADETAADSLRKQLSAVGTRHRHRPNRQTSPLRICTPAG
ncbi:hypothetical protein A6A06_22290 [Streptomyces sp. CB02923]|uniref:hypothetical protein n=1 Tax=Streptomyces sp. CB02923 TaxID=1718985 RepID=UPI00093CFEE1|nr:hypothetical protein [Streptomyces sp. CB02923]OKH99803.1 hypothetical protein A6A06_22290 [Streptomyces sp. CB02923]